MQDPERIAKIIYRPTFIWDNKYLNGRNGGIVEVADARYVAAFTARIKGRRRQLLVRVFIVLVFFALRRVVILVRNLRRTESATKQADLLIINLLEYHEKTRKLNGC